MPGDKPGSKPGAVVWPAVILYHGESELTYVCDLREWQADADLSAFEYDPADRLIDSRGEVFSLSPDRPGSVQPLARGERLAVGEVTALVREHFSSIGACCVSKLNPRSVAQAIDLLAQDPDR